MSQYSLDLKAPSNTGTLGNWTHRPIHYLGSKLRIADEIKSVLGEYVPNKGVVCDLFSGSGVVSSTLSSSWAVVAVDIQEYARVLAAAMLDPAREALEVGCAISGARTSLFEDLSTAMGPLLGLEREALSAAERGDYDLLATLTDAGSFIGFQEDGPDAIPAAVRDAYCAAAGRLVEAGLSNHRSSTITRHFGGLYFGIDQAIVIDSLRGQVEEARESAKDTVLAALLATASTITASVGKQFAQPMRLRYSDGRIKQSTCRRLLENRRQDVVEGFERQLAILCGRPTPRFQGRAVRSDYGEFLREYSGPLDAIYADPPYTRDHYSRFYHVLETICRWDDPSVSNTNLDGRRRISRGVYREDRHQSPFSIRSKAPAAFHTLFGRSRRFDVPIVVSYSPQLSDGASRPRVVAMDTIRKIAREHYSDVRELGIHSDTISHSKLTQVRHHLAAPDYPEVLVVCIP